MRGAPPARPEMGTVLVLGAASAIARAIAERFAREGYGLVLAGRDLAELNLCAADLRVRHEVQVVVLAFDAVDFERHESFFNSCVDVAGPDRLAGMILCHGTLPPQAQAQVDCKLAKQTIDVNFTSAVCVLNLVAEYFERRGKGFICVLSSVAGDRGRQNNYIYGAAKGGLTTYLQGLRQRMAKHGVCVLTVKPGFVDTAMTWGLPGMFLVATPQKVAGDVCRAIARGRAVIYTPWFWIGIMTIIRSIPERVFNRLKL